ncbi:hypothetical protein ACJW30_05G110400 [Castanea mollissima]
MRKAFEDCTCCSTSICKFWHWGFGTWVKWCVQKLWKWAWNEQNPSGKAAANIVPQHWQPNSGLLMANDVSGVHLEESVPCIALSKMIHM